MNPRPQTKSRCNLLERRAQLLPFRFTQVIADIFVVSARDSSDRRHRLAAGISQMERIDSPIRRIRLTRHEPTLLKRINHADQPACMHVQSSRQFALAEPWLTREQPNNPHVSGDEIQRFQCLGKPARGAGAYLRQQKGDRNEPAGMGIGHGFSIAQNNN
jgi:hypothetical protein